MKTTVGYCIVGAGNIGKVHAQALACIPAARLVAVVDADPGRAEALAARYGAQACAGVDEAVSLAEVDVVCVCTPTGAHLEPVLAAAAAGKHVVVEKPLETNVDRADRLLDAIARAGVRSACVLPYRFAAGSLRARAAIAAGRLGRISLAEARVPWWRTQAYYDSAGWRGTLAADGGGALINQALHAIDLMLWLAGPAVSVYGQTARMAHRLETEDSGVAVLQLASGGLATILGGTGCWPGSPAGIAVYGDRGTVALTEGRVERWQLADAEADEAPARVAEDRQTGSGSADPTAIGYEAHRRQLADMTAALIEARDPLFSAADGRACLAVIEAIYRSAAEGRAQRLC